MRWRENGPADSSSLDEPNRDQRTRTLCCQKYNITFYTQISFFFQHFLHTCQSRLTAVINSGGHKLVSALVDILLMDLRYKGPPGTALGRELILTCVTHNVQRDSRKQPRGLLLFQKHPSTSIALWLPTVTLSIQIQNSDSETQNRHPIINTYVLSVALVVFKNPNQRGKRHLSSRQW